MCLEYRAYNRVLGLTPFLVPKGKIHIIGALEISIYQDKINLGCRAEEVREWVKPEA